VAREQGFFYLRVGSLDLLDVKTFMIPALENEKGWNYSSPKNNGNNQTHGNVAMLRLCCK
jgi:hypothetical protein